MKNSVKILTEFYRI